MTVGFNADILPLFTSTDIEHMRVADVSLRRRRSPSNPSGPPSAKKTHGPAFPT